MTVENSTNTTLLRVENLMMHFPIRRGVFQRQVGAVRAVDGVSFDVSRGETLGLVGIGMWKIHNGQSHSSVI